MKSINQRLDRLESEIKPKSRKHTWEEFVKCTQDENCPVCKETGGQLFHDDWVEWIKRNDEEIAELEAKKIRNSKQ